MFLPAAWPAPAAIKAFTTLREGGYSLAPYDSFNLALHVGDEPEQVLANRQRLVKELALPEEPIWLAQVHSNRVLEATLINNNQEADSLFTHQSQRVCAIMTADCLPILLCQPQGGGLAAIHAGWRGLANGIISNTVTALKVPGPELMAWLGPAIGPSQFEVGEEVLQTFLAQDPEQEKAFIPHQAKTWLADLYELARIQLRKQGISAIFGGEYCTFSQNHLFFSYRRDKGQTGRMATLIWRTD